MKWVKVAIGAVIAVMSIGIIATSVYDMTQERLIIVEPEVLIEFEITGNQGGYARDIDVDVKGYIDTNMTYLDENADNIYIVHYDSTGVEKLRKKTVAFAVQQTTANRVVAINYGETTETILFYNETGSFSMVGWEGESRVIGDTFAIILDESYTIPAQLTGINATLLLLTPLIFAGGVLTYLLNKQNY